MEEEDVRRMFSSNKERANYYDSIKDIQNTIKYSFIVCQEDPSDTVCVTKIVYWACFYREYDDIIKLMEVVRNNATQVEKMKQVFYKETKQTIKDLLIKYYIDAVDRKEIQEKNIETKQCSISEHLRDFYLLVVNVNIYEIYDAYIKLKNRI